MKRQRKQQELGDLTVKPVQKTNAANQRRRASEAGYSLLEILVGLAIISALTALVAPRLIGQVDKSKTVTAEAQIKMLSTSLETMRMDIGRYPTAEEGLSLLVQPAGDEPLWNGPYLSGALPEDPWGNLYKYSPDLSGDKVIPRIFTLGADNVPGGSGMDADIDSRRS